MLTGFMIIDSKDPGLTKVPIEIDRYIKRIKIEERHINLLFY
jgi:hypothetical protein